MMKRTTKILIAIFAVTLILTFFLPVIFMKDNADGDLQTVETPVYKMTADGDAEEIELSTFTKIEGVEISDKFMYAFETSYPMVLYVEESDSVESPTVRVNPYWKGNVDIKVENDNLSMYVNMKRLLEDNEEPEDANWYVRIDIPEECKYTATIRVPRGMIRNIKLNSSILNLKGFKDTDMCVTLNHSLLYTYGCRFNCLTVGDDQY